MTLPPNRDEWPAKARNRRNEIFWKLVKTLGLRKAELRAEYETREEFKKLEKEGS